VNNKIGKDPIYRTKGKNIKANNLKVFESKQTKGPEYEYQT
jgi:hypothetical protein